MTRSSRRLGLWLSLLSLGVGGDLRADRGRAPRLLLAVGNNRGLAGEPALRHADRDARRLAAVLASLGGVPRADARVLADRPPAELRQALKALAARARALAARGRRPELVVLYFSGHGGREHLHLAGQRLPIAELKRELAKVPARVRLVIVDACRTARPDRDKGFGRDERPFAISLRSADGQAGVAVIRSASDGEAAQESDELGGAVFSHFLVSALRGGADRDGDRRVTLAEAYAYAYAHTLRRSAASRGPVQHAAVELSLRGAGPLVLTRTAAARARLSLPAGHDVHYLVYRLPAGTAVTEAWSQPGRPLTLALAPGRFLVQRRGRRPGARTVWLGRGEHRRLSAGEFTPIPLQHLARKGGGLVLRRHRLHLGYGLALGPRTSRPGHRLHLGYGLRLTSALTLSAAAQLGLDAHRGALQRTDERWLGGELRLDWSVLELGRLGLRLGAGATLRGIWQRTERTDGDRLEAAGYGQAVEDNQRALGGGPLALLGLSYALTPRWSVTLDAEAVGLLLREDGALALDFKAGARISLQVAF